MNTEHVSTDRTFPHLLPSAAAPAVTPTAGASPQTTPPAPSSTLFHAPPALATPSGSSAARCQPTHCRLEVTHCHRGSTIKRRILFYLPASVQLSPQTIILQLVQIVTNSARRSKIISFPLNIKDFFFILVRAFTIIPNVISTREKHWS